MARSTVALLCIFAAVLFASASAHKGSLTLTDVGTAVTFPAGAEVLGGNAVFKSAVTSSGGLTGTAYWTGVFTAPNEANYVLTIVLEGKGTIAIQGKANGVNDIALVTLAVVGGTGQYEGASGTATWENGTYIIKFSKK